LFAVWIIGSHVASHRASSQDRSASNQNQQNEKSAASIDSAVDDVLYNRLSRDYRWLFADIMKRASLEDLQRMRHHKNLGVAFQSAWCEWVDDKRRLTGFKSDARRESMARIC
jgi:hypothetical protein